MDKLDNFSKVLVATGTINFLASEVNLVNSAMKGVPDAEGFYKDSIKHRDKVLSETVAKLAEIMDNLGEVLNVYDSNSTIQTRISTPAFEILIHGQDDCETDYSEQN